MQGRIVPQNRLPWQVGEWQKQLSESNMSIEQMYTRVKVDRMDHNDVVKADELFKFRVPPAFLAKADLTSAADPLLRQVLPDPNELAEKSGYTEDPLGEQQSRSLPGLLHKYRGRVLLVLTSACAIHCRYCFRRHFPYNENRLNNKQWQQVVDYIVNDPSITEVIFSGGDPLSIKTATLKKRLEPLVAIPHLKRFRFHSRFPVVIPQRIDTELLNWMSELIDVYKKKLVFVVHANHAQELSSDFGIAMSVLKELNVFLLNQTVLLNGVNNSADVLVELSQRLFEYGVMPYYLHLLDPVTGAAHFDVPEKEALEIYSDLLSTLPGYLVPKLVREIKGEPSKTPILTQRQ